MLLLEMFMEGDMGVDPKAGLATLERFIAERKIFVTKSGKPLSFNTIKDDFTEILKEFLYNPQIQISAESETKRSIFREKDKTKRSKKESAQHSKSRNKSFVMTSVSAL